MQKLRGRLAALALLVVLVVLAAPVASARLAGPGPAGTWWQAAWAWVVGLWEKSGLEWGEDPCAGCEQIDEGPGIDDLG